METAHKKVLKSISLELRHLLEGSYDAAGHWHPGDLEQRLAAIGVRRDREPVSVDELPHLSPTDRKARQVVDAYLTLRADAGVDRAEAVAEFVRETAYTWANRLLALRCMEARDLIDEVILQKAAYGGRSLEHHRLAQRQPEVCAGADDGLLAVLDKVFGEQAQHLPMLFDPDAPGVALKPSAAAIKRCMAILSENQKVGDQDVATSDVFKAPDAFGWAYQYWNTEEKGRVFEKVRTQKGAKIEGPDIIPATQLYTEPYMVKFLVQNSLGATWMGMHPDSKLCEKWEYYVRDADRAPVAKKPVSEITFLDPACGSGHFLLEAFDLFYDMYEEEGSGAGQQGPGVVGQGPDSATPTPDHRPPAPTSDPHSICRSILEKNLFGIDIDARAVQIAEVALWMKAAERAFGFEGKPTNLVAAVASHLKGPLWEEFLETFKHEPSIARVLRKFGQAMEHIDELGSLARPDEDLRAIIREEHATWERQVREQQEANYLFAEMVEDELSGQLPFHEVSDEEFGERMLYRARAAVHAFTEKARQAGTFQDQFLGYEATAGFKLLDLLGRKYDVVAANPPYMGSRNMPSVVKDYVFSKYPDSKLDLYQAFLERGTALTVVAGRLALVTPQSWMKHRTLEKLRRKLLESTIIETCAHLGNGAFEEIGGAVVSTTLTVFACSTRPNLKSTFIRLVDEPSARQKAAALVRVTRGKNGSALKTSQVAFLNIPKCPVLYEVSGEMLAMFSDSLVQDCGDICAGLQTSNNLRFVRFEWEARTLTPPTRWVPYEKAGGYRRWYGLQYYRVDWQGDGLRIKQFITTLYKGAHWSKNVRNTHKYFSPGLTYTDVSGYNLGVRWMEPGQIWDICAPAIFPVKDSEAGALIAGLNARITSFFLRLVTSGAMHVSGLHRVPLRISNDLSELGLLATHARKCLASGEPIERAFDPGCYLKGWLGEPSRTLQLYDLSLGALIATLEGIIDSRVMSDYGLSDDSLRHITDHVGKPAGWLPLIVRYDALPPLPAGATVSGDGVGGYLRQHPRLELCDTELVNLKARLRRVYEAGPRGTTQGDCNDSEGEYGDVEEENESDPELGESHIPIPVETSIEGMSLKMGIHPISVYWLLKEGINEGWRSPLAESRLTGDRLTVITLSVLGHRWSGQNESRDFIPDRADSDGIVPLSEGTGEPTLIQRLYDVPNFGFSQRNEGDIAEVMGKPLAQWLVLDFFKHHIGQFKKRPIAWQLQSNKFTVRTRPAFAFFVYYHKLDGDLLEKIRTQYVGPLRQRWETELRGIESVAAAVRSDRQTARRTELGDLIKELQDFDASLRTVQESGFETASLRDGAIQDGLLCMKARWLRRLSETIEGGPLADWKAEAAHVNIHGVLSDWIHDAMAHLDHHCSRVEPEEWESEEAPTSVSLAALICEKPASLVASALQCANQRWWKRLDDEVLTPLRQEMSQKKETLKGVQAELKELAAVTPCPSPGRRGELKGEERRLKQEIKELKSKIDRNKDSAEQLRGTIAAWHCPEAATWEPWLADQPMYDAISSVDGRRPPTTVAEWVAQERSYVPDINDGVRVNIAPVQKAGLLAADVLAKKDLDKAIADRAEWRADERRWCREGKLPQPGWWPV